MPYVASGVAAALIASALCWWNLAEGKPAPASSSPAPVATAAAPVINENPPPPPPPPDTPAAPETKTASAKRAVSSGSNECSATCNGSASPDLQSAARAKAAAARGCYERALRHNDMLQGRMTVAMRVGSSGRICGASIANDSVGDPAVASCVAGLMRAGTLPAPSGGCVDMQIPISFVGKK